MSDLTKSKNLLAEPRVIAACIGLVNKNSRYCSHQPTDQYCDVCGIPGSLAGVAFEMRDACTDKYWQIGIRAVYCEVYGFRPHDEYGLNTDAIMFGGTRATPEQWIIAAVLAFEAQDKE